MTSTTTTTPAPSVAHASFTISRDFPVPVEHAWAAFAEVDQKRQWFGVEPTFDIDAREFDFRVGGHELEDGQWHGGPRSKFLATFTDIVEHERIVLTYDMWIDGKHISTSLVSEEFEPIDGGVRYTHVEHGIHLDGFDDGTQREQGTIGIIDALAAYLGR